VTDEWTVATLYRFFQRQLDDLRSILDERYRTQTEALKAAFAERETAVRAALLSQEKAVTKAEVAADKRFDLLNELRVGVATKEQVDALDKRISEIAARIDRTEGRSTGLSAGWGYVVGAVGLASTVILLVITLTKKG
jgi:hypothetical protein